MHKGENSTYLRKKQNLYFNFLGIQTTQLEKHLSDNID